MKKLLIAGVLGFGLVGCTAPKYNYQAVSQNISKPPINSVNEAYVGDKMLTQGVFTEREAYFIPEAKKKFLFTMPKGFYLKTGEDGKGSYYQAVNNIPDGAIIPGGGIQSILVTPQNDLCFIDIYFNKVCHFKDIGEKRKISVANDNSFQ